MSSAAKHPIAAPPRSANCPIPSVELVAKRPIPAPRTANRPPGVRIVPVTAAPWAQSRSRRPPGYPAADRPPLTPPESEGAVPGARDRHQRAAERAILPPFHRRPAPSPTVRRPPSDEPGLPDDALQPSVTGCPAADGATVDAGARCCLLHRRALSQGLRYRDHPVTVPFCGSRRLTPPVRCYPPVYQVGVEPGPSWRSASIVSKPPPRLPLVPSPFRHHWASWQ